MKTATMICLFLVVIGVLVLAASNVALADEVQELESRVRSLERDIDGMASKGAVLILFGTVCALWAQNTERKPWLWFLMGIIFSVITVLVMLFKNADDLNSGDGPDNKFDLKDYREQ